MALRRDVPVLRLPVGSSSHQIVNVYGFTAEEIGMPLVEIAGLGCQLNLTIEKAEKLAEGVMVAVRRARGEAAPTPLDEFMKRRGGA
ncbi:hypothetical protein PMI42_01698 [Bradyrhizobium sp. YR681]|uniref:hypothetical protein n=1 Tax=Bradyrhizobium sp. YR681 TaxID=1144344 RepID=UPI0002712A45|nr:hypothetical protein [Bradyrhizobium sp. YR681]EJN14725.1 hypothetical protein PMI42_01698 [Bradyrhizobium sp. YR681]